MKLSKKILLLCILCLTSTPISCYELPTVNLGVTNILDGEPIRPTPGKITAGNNIFFINPYWAATIYVTSKYTASWRLYYLWCAKNHATNIKPGQFISQEVVLTGHLYGENAVINRMQGMNMNLSLVKHF